MKEPPSNISHLNRLIDAWHQDAPHITSGRLRRLIGVTALVGLLDDLSTNGEPRLAIKGGAALLIRFGPEARATSDVDAVTNIGLDQAFDEIADRLERGWMGFTGQLGDRTEIVRAGTSPLPKRAKIKLFYKDKSFITLPFELGWAESESFSRTESIR